jgi:hypothetical protein
MRSCCTALSRELLVRTSSKGEGGTVAIWLRRSRRRRLEGSGKSGDDCWHPRMTGIQREQGWHQQKMNTQTPEDTEDTEEGKEKKCGGW